MYRRTLEVLAAVVAVMLALAWIVFWTVNNEPVRLPVDPGYDPGLYTPFTQPPRPPHPIEIYRPPTADGPSSTRSTR